MPLERPWLACRREAPLGSTCRAVVSARHFPSWPGTGTVAFAQAWHTACFASGGPRPVNSTGAPDAQRAQYHGSPRQGLLRALARGDLPKLFRHRVSPTGDRTVSRANNGTAVWRADRQRRLLVIFRLWNRGHARIRRNPPRPARPFHALFGVLRRGRRRPGWTHGAHRRGRPLHLRSVAALHLGIRRLLARDRIDYPAA